MNTFGNHLSLIFQLIDVNSKIQFEGDMSMLRMWLHPGISSNQFRRHICANMADNSWESRLDVCVLNFRMDASEESIHSFTPEQTRCFLLQLLYVAGD